MLQRPMIGQRSQTKSTELLDAAVWDVRAKQYLGTARIYVHLTALCILGFSFGMLSQPASISPLQFSLFLAAWLGYHVVAAQKLMLNKTRIRLLVLSNYLQVLGFMSEIPRDCELWLRTYKFWETIFFPSFFCVLNPEWRLCRVSKCCFSLGIVGGSFSHGSEQATVL